jgi:shikimate kinase
VRCGVMTFMPFSGTPSRQAIDRGELAPGTDLEIALDVITSPMWMRLTLAGETLDLDYAKRLTAMVLRARRGPGSLIAGPSGRWDDVRVIIWLNGTFGAGKTTTARQLADRLQNARHFDPELVGYLLMAALSDHEFTDFQDLPPWRELVPVFTEKIAGFTGQHLIAAQTVLREDYWRELTQGFERTPQGIFHVLLHVDPDVLAERIEADELEAKARRWRLDHISDYEKSRRWLQAAADLVVDATNLSVADVAERIAVEAGKHFAEDG